MTAQRKVAHWGVWNLAFPGWMIFPKFRYLQNSFSCYHWIQRHHILDIPSLLFSFLFWSTRCLMSVWTITVKKCKICAFHQNKNPPSSCVTSCASRGHCAHLQWFTQGPIHAAQTERLRHATSHWQARQMPHHLTKLFLNHCNVIVDNLLKYF